MTDPLFARLSRRDAAPAISAADASLTYSQLADAASAHLAGLRDRGIRPGDRVGVWTFAALDTAVALCAHAAAGVVSVPLNPALGAREFEHVVRDAAPRAIVTARGTRPPHAHDAAPCSEIDTTRSDGTSLDLDATSAASDAPVLVLYTSGTTGAPKGAVLTARNCASNVDALARAWAWTDRDVLAHTLPLFHVHGLVLGLFGTLRAGASLRLLPKFSPEAVASELSATATMLFAVPTMYHRLAEAAEGAPEIARSLARARLLVSGSAPLPAREHARIEALTGQRVVERYGLTETLINCSVRASGDRRAGYVGPALDGVELKLVDDARGEITTRDDATIGEIAVRGPNVFAGYLNRADATAAVRDADGWFYTGDLASIAPDGYVRVVGRRATDLIKTGGFKVGAGEVEAALLEHAAVREAAVVGVPDEDLGEKIVAFVVTREGSAASETELVQHVTAQLAAHKRPRAVHFVAELPRNAMGKVLKSQLRGNSQAK